MSLVSLSQFRPSKGINFKNGQRRIAKEMGSKVRERERERETAAFTGAHAYVYPQLRSQRAVINVAEQIV
jgi:hypothetical protein